MSDENTLEVYRFIHQSSCSDTFTAGYISDNTGIDTQAVSRILDASCELGMCSKRTAHLENGDVVIYQSFGNGKILSIITLAYDELFGNNNYNYNLGGKCKLIRGTQK